MAGCIFSVISVTIRIIRAIRDPSFSHFPIKEAKADETPPPVGNRLDRAWHGCGAGPLASANALPKAD
jgi:hypothetical protein